MRKNKGSTIYGKGETNFFDGFEKIKDTGTMVVIVPDDFYIPTGKLGILKLNPKYRGTYSSLSNNEKNIVRRRRYNRLQDKTSI